MPTPSRLATSADDLASAGVTHRVERYVHQSRAYAAQGRTRMAVLAMWAADVEMLQSLLWESGLASSPDPDAQLAAVAAAVDSSLRGQRIDAAAPADARSVVIEARAALTAVFDESVHALLEERFAALDHLEGPLPAASTAVQARDARLGGRSAPELVTDLRTAAADCMAVAGAMAAAGLSEDARHQARLADVASFEAYLITAAQAAGDHTLATVDLRWDIAVAALDAVVEPPVDLAEAIRVGRDVLVGSLAPAEEDALRSAFEAVAMGSV